MPDRVTHEDVQTGIWETVMIIDYNKSNNITEEERLASFRESVQRALDEQATQLAQIGKTKDQGLTQKVAIAEKRAAFAKQKTESLDQDVVYMQERMDSGEFKGEDGIVLRIDSSRGTVFKNNQVSTVLTVTIFSGSDIITNITQLRTKFGQNAYLQWYWLLMDESDYGIIIATDSKLSNDGFTLTLTPEEVDVKVTFRCELIV